MRCLNMTRRRIWIFGQAEKIPGVVFNENQKWRGDSPPRHFWLNLFLGLLVVGFDVGNRFFDVDERQDH